MRFGGFLVGAMIGALVAGGLIFARLEPQVVARNLGNAQVTVPVLPVEVVVSDKIYDSGLLGSLLQSYSAPMVRSLRTRFPDTLPYGAYRPRDLILEFEGRANPGAGDEPGLFPALDRAARAAGWTPIEALSFRNAVYVMRGYENAGHVFAVLALTDLVYTDQNGLQISSVPAAGGGIGVTADFTPLLVLTDIGSQPPARQPWLHPQAPLLSLESGRAVLVPPG